MSKDSIKFFNKFQIGFQLFNFFFSYFGWSSILIGNRRFSDWKKTYFTIPMWYVCSLSVVFVTFKGYQNMFL